MAPRPPGLADQELAAEISRAEGNHIQIRNTLSMADHKARLEREALPGSYGSLISGKSVYDGTTTKTLSSIKGQDYQQGSVTNQAFPGPQVVDYMAILLSTSPQHLSPISVASGLEFLEVVADEGQGARFKLGLGARPDKTYDYKLLIDPKQGWQINRLNQYDKAGELTSQLDIKYSKHESGLDLPSAWRYLSYRGKELAVRVDGVIESWKLNPEFRDEDFQLTYPVGTRYYDAATKEIRVVKEDSTPKTVINMQVTKATFTPVAPKPVKRDLPWWLIILSLVGALLIVVLVQKRRMA